MWGHVRAAAFLLVLLVCSQLGYSQRPLVDSLRQQLMALQARGNPADSTYIDVLNELAFGYQRLNPDTSLLWAETSRTLSKKAGYQRGLSEALRNIGIVDYLQGNFPKALATFYEALMVAEAIHYDKGIARLYNNIGLIYYGQSKYDQALDAQLKSVAIKEKINDRPGLATSFNNIANIYKNQGKFQESLTFHFRSLIIKREQKDTRSIAASLNNIAWLFLKQKNFRDARKYFQEAEPLNKVVGDKVLGSDIAQGMAECYLESKEYEKALVYAQSALSTAQSIHLKDQLRDCNETLSKIYKAMGNHRAALSHFEVFKSYADSINSSEIENRTASLEADYEYQRRESALKARQEVLNKEYETNRLQQRWILASTLVGLTLVSVLAFVLFYSRKKIQHAYRQLEEANLNDRLKTETLHVTNEELNRQKEEIELQRDVVSEQNQKLQEASAIIEEQNKEISRRIENLESDVANRTRELLEYNQRLEQFAFITAHNLRAPVATILGLGNLLSLAGNDPSEAKIIYDKLFFTTRELDRVVRDLNTILDIRKNSTAVLSEIELNEELELLRANLDKEIQDTNAFIESDFSQVGSVHAVKPYLDSVLFNLVSNAIKYRHPDRVPRVAITSKRVNGSVCLSIADNGMGIDLNQHRSKMFSLYSRFHTHVEGKGFGLHMVKTQLAAMGGTIEVESVVGSGTTFFVYLPSKRAVLSSSN